MTDPDENWDEAFDNDADRELDRPWYEECDDDEGLGRF